MIRKHTWILLGVFALLVAFMLYLQKNPLPSSASKTPSPTPAALVLNGWSANDIVWMELKVSQGSTIQLIQDAQGIWTLGPGGKEKVDTGLAEEIKSQVVEMRTTAALPAGYQLDVIGLNAPARVLTLRNKQGKQTEIRFGKADPTDSGYYVQVDNQAPVLVDKTTADGTLDLFNNALPTPTPSPTSKTGETAQPTLSGTPQPGETATP